LSAGISGVCCCDGKKIITIETCHCIRPQWPSRVLVSTFTGLQIQL
jgi:hypothetical protein